AEPVEIDEATGGDKPATRVTRLSSSMGLSVLLDPATTAIEVEVRYGEYTYLPKSETNEQACWARQPRAATVRLSLGTRTPNHGTSEVPDSGGVEIAWSLRRTPELSEASGLPKGTRSLSVFVVNRRKPAASEVADQSSMFQVELTLRTAEPLVPRPNLQHLKSQDLDERVADLQYRDACEYSVGHSVATMAERDEAGSCRLVRTTWLPTAEVEKVMPAEIPGVNLKMDELAALADAAAAREQLGGLAREYRKWIETQRQLLSGLHSRRKETGDELLRRATIAASRIEAGIELMSKPDCLEAFRIANRAMASQGRRRLARMLNKQPSEVAPKWRPFQLAFLLMNLKGIAEPTSDDREVVDLLFFPTGGGKTEAYLGLAAFTLVLRRLRNPGVASAGLSVLMRYTLRLLTLDQLGRAAALICALELEREKDVEKLGRWPFEIGLWVGQAATPNVMGRKGDNNPNSARAKTIAYSNDDRKPSPIPLETCP
ncbi:MAG: helicase, partial [Planctomycetota bacterium]